MQWTVLLLLLLVVSYFVSLLCKRRSLTLSIGIIFLIEIIWNILSCAYLDAGNVYIMETGINSYHTGSLIRMLILYFPLIIILSSKSSGKIRKLYNNKIYIKKINCDSCIRVILFFSLLVVSYCILDMIISGIPFFSSEVTRINYSRYSKLPFATRLNGEITFFGMLVAGIAYFNRDNKFNKKVALSFFIISIIYRILMEYKYHGMYNIIYSFFLPKLINFYESKKYKIFSLKNAMKLIITVFSALLFCLFIYSKVNKNFNSRELLFDRIFALQSHTFWTLDEKLYFSDNMKGSIENLNNEVIAVINNLGEHDVNSGIIKVMYNISNTITVNANLSNGVRWAGSYLTVGINTIGYYGTFIISFLLGTILLLDMKILYTSMINQEFLILYFAQSFMWDLLDYFRIGNWCLLLNIKTMISFVILIIVYLLKKKQEVIK